MRSPHSPPPTPINPAQSHHILQQLTTYFFSCLMLQIGSIVILLVCVPSPSTPSSFAMCASTSSFSAFHFACVFFPPISTRLQSCILCNIQVYIIYRFTFFVWKDLYLIFHCLVLSLALSRPFHTRSHLVLSPLLIFYVVLSSASSARGASPAPLVVAPK